MDRNSAYYELLERYRPMVWRLCWRHARGDWDRCNDLVQEVSIALWEHFGQLRHDATTQEQRAWVRWQARSVLDLQRRKQHLVTEPFTDAMTETLVDEPESDKEKVAEVMELLTPEEDCNAIPEVETDGIIVRLQDNAIVVEGAKGETVRLYDAGGRLQATGTCNITCRLPLPAAGIYLVQVGDRPARKITFAL